MKNISLNLVNRIIEKISEKGGDYAKEVDKYLLKPSERKIQNISSNFGFFNEILNEEKIDDFKITTEILEETCVIPSMKRQIQKLKLINNLLLDNSRINCNSL